MIATPSPEHGRDLTEEKIEAGMHSAKLSAANAHEFADAPYAIVRQFQANTSKLEESLAATVQAHQEGVKRFRAKLGE